MDELHNVIFALRPPDLDDVGVVAAVERYVNQINRTGLPCELEVVGEQRRPSPETRLSVYRIVQEALHNALRHAHADEALVKLGSSTMSCAFRFGTMGRDSIPIRQLARCPGTDEHEREQRHRRRFRYHFAPWRWHYRRFAAFVAE